MWLKRKNNALLVAITFITTLIVLHLSKYDNDLVLSDFQSAYYLGTDAFSKLLKKRITRNQLVVPADFPLDGKELVELVKLSKTFNMKELGNPKIMKVHEIQSPLTKQAIHGTYHEHEVKLFNDLKAIDLDLDKCSSIQNTFNVEIDAPVSVDASLTEILTKILEEVELNPYYKEMSPFFINELKLQLEYKVVDHYWYRLAGSSVWLEQYQAHFMISRILYSPKGHRNQPIVSFTYGQLFDKNWNELVNTKIVVPTNNLNPKKEPNTQEKTKDDKKKLSQKEEEKEEKEEKHYKVIKFPYILPIPFWHDFDDIEGKYYGPEDPRLILVKNKAGYEEPLIVFNAYHRKLTHFDDDTDDRILLKAEFYRSMFICWPWQFQRGKKNTDGYTDAVYDRNHYNKVVELKIKNLPRRGKQKNWTPFISELDREVAGYDKHVQFVYRWANFEVLKCDLVYGTGICSFVYRLNPNLNTKEAVGPLRGGTELVNINGLLGKDAKKYIPTNREIWVGFARAHIDDCGCGNNMYRPNLVVVTKDTELDREMYKNEYGDSEYREITKKHFKISHISSSISLDIPIIGWDLLKPQEVCVGPNILIPNGISMWTIKESSDETFEDYLTLSLSISDFTIHRINIRGLLKELIEVNDNHIFNEVFESGATEGYNNDNVICALQSSSDFCYQYGLENQGESESADVHKIFDSETFVADEDEFNLEQFEEFQEEDVDIAAYERALYLQKIHQMYGDKPKYRPSPRPNTQAQAPPHRQNLPGSTEGKTDANSSNKKIGSGTYATKAGASAKKPAWKKTGQKSGLSAVESDTSVGAKSSGTKNTGTKNTGTKNTGTKNTGTKNTGTKNAGTKNTGSTDAKKVDAKKVDAKKVDAKKVDAKKVDAKKVDAKKVDAKKVDAKKVDAKKVDAKKVDAKKVDAKKVDAKKVDAKKPDSKKVDEKKTDAKKVDAKKTDAKLADSKAPTKQANTEKVDAKKADTKKADAKKADAKKADAKKADAKKADTKKADTKKADTKKAETKKTQK